MTYPNYEDKHLEEALFTAQDYMRYKKLNLGKVPEDYILLYQKEPLNHFKRKYRGNYDKMKISSLMQFYKFGDIGIVKMNGIGSPHAGTVIEELIALGGKRFLNLGTAGGLQREGIFLCERAIRDEGTSAHYLAHEKYSYPDEELTSLLEESLERRGIEFERATTWTIDTPYRETRAEVEHYRNEGVATVEMEAAALFAIAKLRNVKIASAFAVSDILLKEWQPKFHTLNLKRSLNNLLDTGIDCLARR